LYVTDIGGLCGGPRLASMRTMTMNRLSLGLGALLFPACVAAPDTGTKAQPIIGGQTASTTTYRTVVDLENGPGDWFCTGTLIDKDWVLTAAHCMEDETVGNLNIRFDDDNINNTTGGIVVAVSEIHANPAFNFQDWDNDIALLKLATSVTDREPTPINRDPVAFATSVTEVGYGDSDNNGGGAGILRKLVTPTVDCAMAADPGITNANLLCFNASDGNSSCYGDSGGPAFITVGGKLQVVGITSGGTEDQCTAGWDLYTSVHGELAFADQIMLGTPPPNPDPDPDPNGDPMNPDPTGPGSDPTMDDPKDSSGGCSTGGSGGGLLLVGAALATVARRRTRGTGRTP
jgi:secreted trypsin-like serine protease